MTTFNRYHVDSPLFLSSAQGADALHAAYLLPNTTVTPDSFSVADALNKYPGWFILFNIAKQDTATIDAFAAAAQIYLSSNDRSDALIAWFTNADNYASGLTAWVVTAPRANNPITINRPTLIEFANFAVNLTPGTTITASSDGNGLTFTYTTTPNTLVVTPFGQRNPIALPMTSTATLNMLAPTTTTGCITFGLALSNETATALDIGLRIFTAGSKGGYVATARLPVFDLTRLTAALPLNATLDPLAPLNHTRTMLTFASSVSNIATTYLTPVGGQISVTPTSSAALVFCERLIAVDAQGNPVVVPGNQVLYLVPSGAFSIITTPPTTTGNNGVPDLTATLMCGLSAVEYLSFAAEATLSFLPDQLAFATLHDADPKSGAGRIFGQLTAAASTSWAFLNAPNNSYYYAQPDSSVLFQSPGAAATFLNYLPLIVGDLQPQIAPKDCYPLFPYSAAVPSVGLTSDDIAQFELQACAPKRRALIQKIALPPKMQLQLQSNPLADPKLAATPQGLLLQFGASLSWSQLTVAVSPSPIIPPNRQSQLLLNSVIGDLKDALQTNQLFLVASVGDLFLNEHASIGYSLTQERLNLIASVGEDPDVITRLQPLVPTQWASESTLNTSLQSVLTADQYAAELKNGTIRGYIGDFSLFVAGWEFDLSPWRWADHKSILLFKFCKKQLSQLVADSTQWTMADSFNSARNATQQQIQDIFTDAQTRCTGDNDFAYFVNTVMSNANWNGILILNATVPLSGLPPQMEGIAAGIDASQFRAHHVGINVTPVQLTDTTSSVMPSSVFALIDYEDRAPLVSSDDYQFKVNSLKVLIANSNIASFSSEIELLINTLFGEPVQQINASDNNLIFNGYYQQSNGVGCYKFITANQTAYQASSAVLYQVSIQSANFVTIVDNNNNPNNTTTHSYFGLTGAISFLPQPGFDFFSFGPEQTVIDAGGVGGGLNYTDLCIDMSFDQATPTLKNFTFDLKRIVTDAAASQVRAASLAAHFPMKLIGITQGIGTVTPDSLGFMPVDSPVQGSELQAPWFGLRFELDLGSPGALAAEIGFTAGLLLGWAPSPLTPVVYIGLSLPGVSGGQRAISLEGILSLNFGDVLFIAQPPTYILQLSDIALKFLSLSFPPNGQVNLLLFGNPDAPTSGALGWYASYLKNGAGGSSKQQQFLANPSIKPLAHLLSTQQSESGKYHL